jgi:hypothetical protein
MSTEEWKKQTLELWALKMSDLWDIKNIAESIPKSLIERQGCSISDLTSVIRSENENVLVLNSKLIINISQNS